MDHDVTAGVYAFGSGPLNLARSGVAHSECAMECAVSIATGNLTYTFRHPVVARLELLIGTAPAEGHSVGLQDAAPTKERQGVRRFIDDDTIRRTTDANVIAAACCSVYSSNCDEAE